MELPSQLAGVHSMVEDVAPFPPPDEEERLGSARAWIDLGLALRTASAEMEPAARHLWQTNEGADVAAFKKHWEGEDGPGRQLAAGSEAALQSGIGTLIYVLLRAMWKGLIIYVLVWLAISLLAAVLTGPAVREFIRLAKVRGARMSLTTIRESLRQLISGILRDTLRKARGILSNLGVVFAAPVVSPALAVWKLDYGMMDSDEDARRRTEEVLRETPAGREALAWAKKHGITVIFNHSDLNDSEGIVGLGDFNDELDVLRIGGANTRSPEDLAATFVHEVNHARHQGGPNPLTMGREEFVNAAVQEEIDGEIRGHEFRVQLAAARGEPYTGSSDYGRAYQAAVHDENYRRSEQGLPELTADEAQRVGDRAGREALQEWARSTGYYEQFNRQYDLRFLEPIKILGTPS
ncbi:hypothetical protein FH608_034400 [Nonomuraea phyllanthi]|uniref:Uncharacterized protein n=1 Tax=Nonomuraea phyllanthi TaxID=2219224 RepID=A0A5C4W029_9ACTN|nr:hypothetical protein [Nonomuraea phyllanthi]KAB8190608.1 hypothetical protein FH608_034400 [Nonomuraea phyllanthi]